MSLEAIHSITHLQIINSTIYVTQKVMLLCLFHFDCSLPGSGGLKTVEIQNTEKVTFPPRALPNESYVRFHANTYLRVK